MAVIVTVDKINLNKSLKSANNIQNKLEQFSLID